MQRQQIVWEKIFARNISVLATSALCHHKVEGFSAGSIKWSRSKNEVAVIYNAPLVRFFFPSSDKNTAEKMNVKYLLRNDIMAFIDSLSLIEDEIMLMFSLKHWRDTDNVCMLYDRHKRSLAFMAWGYLAFSHVAEVLQKQITVQQWKDIHETLSPHKETVLMREHRAIENAAQKSHVQKNQRKIAQSLVRDFGWLHAEYKSQPWTARDYLNEFVNVNHAQSKNRDDVTSYSIYDKDIQCLIDIMRRIMYVFDEGKTAVVYTNWLLRTTVRSLGYDDEQILLCTEEEFFAWVNGGDMPPKDILEKRKKYYAAIIRSGVLQEFFEQEEIKSILEKENINDFNFVSRDIDIIRGETAFSGTVRGSARIVLTHEDVGKVQEGDIMVSSMTTPELIGAMRKAAAFITDEGGILCHAAIIAREMQKPCIIGTKNATKVFKDGDRVEVDASEGVVRILEKNNKDKNGKKESDNSHTKVMSRTEQRSGTGAEKGVVKILKK